MRLAWNDFLSETRMAAERPPLSSPHCAPHTAPKASSGLARKRGACASVAVRNHCFGKRIDILSLSTSPTLSLSLQYLEGVCSEVRSTRTSSTETVPSREGSVHVLRPRGSHTSSPCGQAALSSCRVVHLSLGIRDAGQRKLPKLPRRDGSRGNIPGPQVRVWPECALRTAALAPFAGVPTWGSLTQREGHGPGHGTTLIGAELSDKCPHFYFLV